MAERSISPSSTRATPTLQALANELDSIENWHRLGVNLGFQGHQLREIERNYNRDNNRCKIEMLDLWLRDTRNPTWEAIIRALDQMQARVVADNIRRRYCSSSTALSSGKYMYSQFSAFNMYVGVLNINKKWKKIEACHTSVSWDSEHPKHIGKALIQVDFPHAQGQWKTPLDWEGRSWI